MQSWRGERQTEIVHNSPPRVCINPHFYYFMHRIKWISCGNAMRETAKKNTCLAALSCSFRRMVVIFLKWHGIRQNFYKLHYTSFTSSSDRFMRLLDVELLSFFHGVIPSTPIHRCMNQCEWIEGWFFCFGSSIGTAGCAWRAVVRSGDEAKARTLRSRVVLCRVRFFVSDWLLNRSKLSSAHNCVISTVVNLWSWQRCDRETESELRIEWK